VQLLLRGFIFRIIFTGIGFLISLLIAKLAGASQFGTLSLIIVNAALIHIITGLGTDAAIVWHGVAGTNYDRNKIFSFTVITAAIQLLFFYIIAILGYFFLGHTLLGGSYELRIFFPEIIYFKRISDSISYCLYEVSDGVCLITFVATQKNKKHCRHR